MKNKEYQNLDRNYSVRLPAGPLKGEIDIIAKKSDIISFIEVKTLRGRVVLINSEEKVDFGKQKN